MHPSEDVESGLDPRITRVLSTSASVAAVQPVFQPIFDLRTGSVVGAEALARWPQSPGVNPAEVIAEARRQGRVSEIDQACRNAALRAATARGHLDDGLTMFINAEPEALVEHFATREVFEVSTQGSRVILELTERALLDNPAQLLTVVAQAREQGLGIALDDVGTHPDSLTLLSLIAPDVVKLDGSLIAGPPTNEQLRVITAVNAYAEATGASILAEGIETDEHRRRAVDMGATLGQGWLLGRPAALPPKRWPPVHLAERPRIDTDLLHIPDTPSRLGLRSQAVKKQILVRYSRFLEDQATASSEPLTILASFQNAEHLTDVVAGRYTELAAKNPLVAVIGIDMPTAPAAGVRGTAITRRHALADEWSLVIFGQHFFVALIARELEATHDADVPAADRRREYRYTLSYDRATVAAAGRGLLQYMN